MEDPLVVSWLADSLRNENSSIWLVVYSEYYCNLFAAWVHTLRVYKLFDRLDAMVLRHFDKLDTSKLKNGPGEEAAFAMYGNMRRAVDEIPMVALFGSARVHEVRLHAPRGAALAAVVNACVDQVTSLRRAAERAEERGLKSAWSIIGQAVARAEDGGEI